MHEDAQRLQGEAAGLRRALQDAELDMQRMSVSHKSEAEENLKVRHRRCLMERSTSLNQKLYSSPARGLSLSVRHERNRRISHGLAHSCPELS